MKLPIDIAKAPFKTKYLDEETPMLSYWFIFGQYPNGNVDISNADGDVFINAPKDKAIKIVNLREKFIKELVTMINE